MVTWAAAVNITLKLGSSAAKAFLRLASLHKPVLAPTLDPFDDPQMLRAFRVKLVNVSDARVRLDDIFIRVPEGSEFAINWHVPMFVLGEVSSPSIPWTRSRRYSINHALDPGDDYECEIGIPTGFAISVSRRPPVTIAVSLTTLGANEQKLVEDIQRYIVV